MSLLVSNPIPHIDALHDSDSKHNSKFIFEQVMETKAVSAF